MALRPIDNALPISPERLKKQPKLAVALLKQSDFRMNDENKVALPPTADAVIDYIASDKLEPLPASETEIQCLIEELESKDWTKVCESLNKVRRFAIYHPRLLHPTLEKVLPILVKAVKNPRSALCKTAVMTSSDIFTSFGDNLLDCAAPDASDHLLMQLLLKASQDKKFVCEEADKALNAMVNSMTPLPLLNKLKAYVSHANLRIRAKAAVSISECVSKMGLEEMKDFGLVALLQMAADLLNDRLPEAREAARKIAVSIFKATTENEEKKLESWQDFCSSSLTALHAQSMIKVAPSE